jgi:hypothetical protein
MDPNHYRQWGSPFDNRCPHVEKKAIFASRLGIEPSAPTLVTSLTAAVPVAPARTQ